MTQKQNRTKVLCLILTFVLFGAQLILAETAKVPQRSEIEDKYKWDLTDIYPDMESWEADFTFVKENMPRLATYKGRLSESGSVLLEFLNLQEALNKKADNLYVFAYLSLDEDNRESKFQELGGRISALASEMSEAVSFMEPELLSIPGDKMLSLLNAHPELDIYRFHFEDLIRQREHVLTDKEEALLALAGPMASSPSKIFNMLTQADLSSYGLVKDEEGNEVELTRGRYSKFLKSPDRRVRRDANHAYNNTYLKHANTLAATLAASVKKDYFYAKARGYNTCLEMSLNQYNIPTSVFYNLIDAVNANLDPLHKWTRLRKKILKLDTLYTYDLYAPLIENMEKDYSWEDATDVVLQGLKPMGESYLASFAKGLNSGWIDVYETEGKGSGAYQWGTYTTHPYVLMNFNGTLDWVFTLAHEMGHAMHSSYTNKKEPYLYENHSLFVAEVASTCNEAVLMKYMLKNAANKKEKIVLLNHYIEQIVGTFYTQVMFSEFERAIHERIEGGGAFSADYFRKTYREIYQKYWGPELVIDEINDLGGMRISHFYRQFYVYQYATCYAAAQQMSQKILNGEEGYLDTYEAFISTGSSKFPVDILKDAGVDMNSPEPINRTLTLFGELVDEMEALLGEG